MPSTAASRAVTAVWRQLGFIVVGLVLIYCLRRAFDPPRLNWGDSASDYNVMMTGRNFAQYGFVALRFTPHLLDPKDIVRPRDNVYLYTHYPQLPDLMNGALRKLGLSTIVQFRLVALLFSFASLFFVYQLACMYWSRTVGQITLALWVTNPMWIQHADYLHHIPYGAFFGFGSLYMLTRYLREGEQRRWLVWSSILVFFTVFASYDWWFCEPLLLAAVVMTHYHSIISKPVARVLGILAAVTVGAIAIKFASNAWGLGGWHQFVADLRFQIRERASDRVVRTGYQAAAWRTLVGRVDRFFTPLLFIVTAFWLAAPLLRRPLASRGIVIPRMANPIVLLFAVLPFLSLFVEVWVAQYYPAVQVIPFYAVGCAALAVLLLDAPHRAVKVTGAAFVIALLASSVDEDTCTFPIAYFPPAAIATLGAQLDSVSPHGTEVLANHIFDSAYRYYFGRRIMTTTLIPPREAEITFQHLGDYKKEPMRATPNGAIFVRHKHIADQLYDKGYYYMVSRYKYWDQWASPRRHRAALDSLVNITDEVIAAGAERVGEKLFETEYYTVWRILPPR